MLFDLRGRGRRNTIKVIYLSLAILMGGGLVLFGIGGGTSGGLVDAITQGGGGGGDAGQDRFTKRETQALAATRRDAEDQAAWAELARARFSLAGIGGNFDTSRNAYTDPGRAKLRQASDAWERFLSLNPSPTEASRVASLMVQAYAPDGLNEAEKLVTAQELIAEARPGPNTYAQLATSAYAAGQKRKGDLAKDKALELSPKDEREALRGQIEQAARGTGAAAG
ncbi:MAG: hypothetical protein H0V22_10240 [Solirubrobacterales bacterium]|jgi:hypothetical protein|nr:hypothetical protein [Solirubrobacterales bacterium]